MDNIKDRLIKFIEYKGLTKNKFEKLCGLAPRYVSNIGKSIQSDVIEKIISVFPELSIEWLVMNRGAMLSEKTEDKALLLETIKSLNYTINEQRIKIEQLQNAIKNQGADAAGVVHNADKF